MCYIRDNKNKSGSRIKVIHLVSNQEKIEHYNPSAPKFKRGYYVTKD
jgi:hypothetical protein